MYRILFICHGNICRSPMAEFIMKSLVREAGLEKDFHIESAAVSAEEIGNGIYPPARRCLSAHGIPFDSTRTAWQLTPREYGRFDLLIYMDRSNLRWLRRILGGGQGNGRGFDPEGKIHLMMEYAGLTRDVADPWYTDDFETTYRDLTTACTALLRQLTERS